MWAASLFHLRLSGYHRAMRRLIVGDIHAHYDMLRRVLDEASFDPSSDTLYSVGDLCDRGGCPVETLRFLMGLPDFRPVLGNHDAWLEAYLWTGIPDSVWYSWDGGEDTVGKLAAVDHEEKARMMAWFLSFPVVRVEDDLIVVHGGIPSGYDEEALVDISHDDRTVPLLLSPERGRLEPLLWDRSYLFSAMNGLGITREDRIPEHRVEPLDTHRRIFIGHTQIRPECVPFISRRYHLNAIDTGAGSGRGPLTVMDIETGEYWQAEADGVRV